MRPPTPPSAMLNYLVFQVAKSREKSLLGGHCKISKTEVRKNEVWPDPICLHRESTRVLQGEGQDVWIQSYVHVCECVCVCVCISVCLFCVALIICVCGAGTHTCAAHLAPQNFFLPGSTLGYLICS